MSQLARTRLIFITGTDTGVGKTLLTALLLLHLRRAGCHALAIKPLASGSEADTQLLLTLQDNELTLDDITPFFFAEPLAPLVAARKHGRTVVWSSVLGHIRDVASRCECLIIEGIGGLLVPLGEGFTVKDLIARLRPEVILVSRNCLGTINHTLLTASALKHTQISALTTVLMAPRQPDPSTPSNPRILRELLAPNPVFALPFLGRNPLQPRALRGSSKQAEKTLARILASHVICRSRSLRRQGGG